MAPARENAIAEDADMIFILTAVAACEDFKVDAQAVAKAFSMPNKNNVYPKLHKILKKYGFVYKDKRIMRDGDEASLDKTAVSTPGKRSAGKKKGEDKNDTAASRIKTPSKTASKNDKAKATPSVKKRKLQETTEAEDEDGQVGGARDDDHDDGVEGGQDGEGAAA